LARLTIGALLALIAGAGAGALLPTASAMAAPTATGADPDEHLIPGIRHSARSRVRTALATPRVPGAPSCSGSFNATTSQNPVAGNNEFQGLAVVSGTDAWAVGRTQVVGSPPKTLVERWNGTIWTAVASPNHGTERNDLFGVAAGSATNVWTVGRYRDFSGSPFKTLVEHWDGAVWTEIASPNPDTVYNSLFSVAVASPSDAWAVGNYRTVVGPGTRAHPLIERWDGISWTVKLIPDVVGSTGDNVLRGVSVVGTDVWAVGGYRPTPTSPYETLIERWDGTAWNVVPSPAKLPGTTGGNFLWSVAGSSSTAVWAVGTAQVSPGSTSYRTLVMNWNGTAWSIVPSQDVAIDSELLSVTTAPGGDVWAVGLSGTPAGSRTLVERLYRGSFSTAGSANPSAPFNELYAVAAVSANDILAVGVMGSDGALQTLAEEFCPPPARMTAASSVQYSLANSDGSTWQEMDGTNLSLSVTPSADSTAILSANADLWTANAGYNQDLGIYVTPSDGVANPANIVAWKESGGFAGTYSPNAAYVQTVYPMTAGITYSVKIMWKTNTNAPGATIFAGAGPTGNFSPTRLTAQMFPAGPNPYTVVSTQQYQLSSSDGATWMDMDASTLKLSITPAANATALLGANVDLWTANAGFNQDVGIFVNDVLVAWKESGGFAGTFSPNAAFVETVYPMTANIPYVVKLKWKTNKNAPGATIFAAAGAQGNFSPTRLTAQMFPAGPNPYTAVSTQQYQLSSSDGATWMDMDASTLTLSITPAANATALLGANVDLWTANAGFNQDVGIFVNDVLVAWKESGGFAGTFSPNAAFVETVYPMTANIPYVVKLKWKTNTNALGATIFAAAGPAGNFSPTRLVMQLT
jgi:hypothetical protein